MFWFGVRLPRFRSFKGRRFLKIRKLGSKGAMLRHRCSLIVKILNEVWNIYIDVHYLVGRQSCFEIQTSK